MRSSAITMLLTCLIFFLGCSTQVKKRDVPKDEILKAIRTFIQSENGFKSLQNIKLLQAEEVILSNQKALKTKSNYIVWKALASVDHVCDGCPIQDLENKTALFIVTEDESNHYEAHLHTFSLQGKNPMAIFMCKPFMEEIETTSRYTHTKGVELNDAEPVIWTNEEYIYPADLHPTKIPIPQMDGIAIDKKETILDIKGDGIFAIWNSTTKNLTINDSYARRKVTLKKGDSPVVFDEYYNFVEGRRIKFIVE
jgi:hypothetical protein